MRTNKQLQKEALAHYDRMIAWAEKQPKRGKPSHVKMASYIGEWAGPAKCSYCVEYGYDCLQCPLGPTVCCGKLYGKMIDAKTWGTWVKRAKLVRQYIEEHGA